MLTRQTVVKARDGHRNDGSTDPSDNEFVVDLGVLLIPVAQLAANVNFATGAFRRLFQSAESTHPPNERDDVGEQESRQEMLVAGMPFRFCARHLPIAFACSSSRCDNLEPKVDHLVDHFTWFDLSTTNE